jgi:DNA modification methylase
MLNTVLFGDCRESLRAMAAAGVKVQTCVTSPPYFGMRSYKGGENEIGQEKTPDQFVASLVEVFREVRNVLSDDGTLWVNIGDTYATGTSAGRQQSANPGIGANRPESQNSMARIGNPPGCKTKDLVGIPWLLALALRADGWYLRQSIIWHKTNPAPGGRSTTDRCEKSHEHIFLLSKRERYYFDLEAVKEPKADGSGMRVRHDVWEISVASYKGAHFAVFPPALVEPCILAGSRPGDVVLDPFMGSGTTAAVAIKHGRQFAGCELNTDYKRLQDERIAAARAAMAPVETPQQDLFEEAA